MVPFSQVVKEKAVVSTALCPSAKQQSGKERGVSVKGRESGKKICEMFFLGIYQLRVFYVYIFEISFLYNQISSVISFWLLLLSLVKRLQLHLHGRGGKYPKLIFLTFVFIRWTK